MIIKEIKYEKSLFFGKLKIIIISDKGKSVLKNIKIEKGRIEKLNSEIKGFELNNIEDFEKLSEKIMNINESAEIELGILNSYSHGWKIIDENSKQIPRPIFPVYKKEKGIKEFYILSLDANNFDGVINTCKEIHNIVKQKIDKAIKVLNDEEILVIIKESIDEMLNELDFELRIGVAFNNFINEKYEYDSFSYGIEEQFNYVTQLIKNYDLVYVENPFGINSPEHYLKLTKEHIDNCLICLNSNNFNDIKNKSYNAFVVDYKNFKNFNSNIKYLRENKINVIAEGHSDLLNLIVGFKIPLIKCENEKEIENITKKLFYIGNEMKILS